MSYTLVLTRSQAGEIISKYQSYSVSHTNNYTLFRAKYKSASLTIFKTLKMLIQGTGSEELFKEICEMFDLDSNIESKKSHYQINLSIIGTDEVGTGDFFGPIVVVGAFVPKNQISSLMKLGVKDSKQLNDVKIMEIAPIIMKEVKYSALVLDNVKYNYLTRVCNFNMNKIKALLHNNVIYNILQKVDSYDEIIIDAFTTQNKYFDYIKDQKQIIENVKLEEKGENKYISIAVASIIARYIFLREMEKLSKDVGFDLPKGAGNKVDLAIIKVIKEKTERYLDLIGKTNFKNVEKAKKKDMH